MSAFPREFKNLVPVDPANANRYEVLDEAGNPTGQYTHLRYAPGALQVPDPTAVNKQWMQPIEEQLALVDDMAREMTKIVTGTYVGNGTDSVVSLSFPFEVKCIIVSRTNGVGPTSIFIKPSSNSTSYQNYQAGGGLQQWTSYGYFSTGFFSGNSVSLGGLTGSNVSYGLNAAGIPYAYVAIG